MVCWRINLSAYPLLTTYSYHHRWPWLLCRWGPVCWCLPIWYQRVRWVVNRKTSRDSIPYKSKICFFAGFMNCVASKCSPHFSIWCSGSLLPSSWDLHDGNLSPMFYFSEWWETYYHNINTTSLIETCRNIKQISIGCFYTDLYCHPFLQGAKFVCEAFPRAIF